MTAADTDSTAGPPADPTGAPRGLGRASMWVAAGTAASRITGFARVFALSYAIGQGPLADLFTKANAAPNLVFELVIGGVLSATLVPVFVAANDEGDEETTSVLLSIGFVVAVGLSLLALAATWATDVVWGGHLADTGTAAALERFHIVTDLLYLLLPQILFYGIASLATAYLNARRRYRTAAFAPVLTNVVSIAAFVVVGLELQGATGILRATTRDLETLLWLGVGTTAGIVAMTIPMLVDMRRTETVIRFLPQWRHPAVRKVTRLSGWTFGYVIANQLALLAVLALLSEQKRYSDAFIFFQLPHGLIAVTIMTTMTPELSSAAGRGDHQGLADQFVRGWRLLLAFILPAAVGYILLASPITSLLVRGNLSAADASATARVVVAFAVGLPAFSTYLFACRGFYAMSDTKGPFVLNVIENGVNIALLVGLAVAGAATPTWFAAAYSIAYTVAAVTALARLQRKLRGLDPTLRRPDLSPLVRMLAAAAAMAATVWLVRQVLPDDAGPGAIAAVAVSMLAGGAVYLGVGLALGIEEFAQARDGALRRLRSSSPT